MPEPKTLEQVAVALEKHGWTQGDYVRQDTGALCLSAAMGEAWHHDPLYYEDTEYLREDEIPLVLPLAEAVLGKHPSLADAGGNPLDLGVQGALVVLMLWNDNVAGTRENVLVLLRKGEVVT